MKRIIPVLLLLLCTSCDQDILNITPQDRIAEDAVWSDVNLIEAYHSELYQGVPHGYHINLYSKYTDEAYNAAPCCGNEFALNTISPDNIGGLGGGDFWGSYIYYWNRGYEYIRKVNVFLDEMEEIEIELPDKERLVAEAKFLRAFMHWELIKRFGGVPIIDEVYELDDLQEGVQLTRASFEEVVAFIDQDLNEAMAVLPDRYPSTDANYGRATGDAALALRSRMYLYAASPLHNPSNDMQKWQRASDASEALLNRGYSLYPDYQELFLLDQGESQDEVIFPRGFTTSSGHQAPMHNFNRRYEGYGGWWGSNGPSANLIDDYDMVNGEPAFLPDGSVNPSSGYDPQNPFENRDPRLYDTVVLDGDTFRGDQFEMWVSEDGTQWGYDNYKNTGDNPRTNTVLKKFMPTDGPFNWSTTFTNQWPHFRLGEIYLNYAEARFELGDEATARQYVSMVRDRVGMPPIPASVTGEDLRRRIYNERRIELAFENHRFFDVRRWKMGDEVENGPITTYDIFLDLDTGEKRYEKVTLLDKTGTWEEHMNLLPIAEDEIRNHPSLEQTPGY